MDLDFRIGDRGRGRGGTPLGVSARHAIAIARFGTFSTLKNYSAKGCRRFEMVAPRPYRSRESSAMGM
jgi:hypothetical protein